MRHYRVSVCHYRVSVHHYRVSVHHYRVDARLPAGALLMLKRPAGLIRDYFVNTVARRARTHAYTHARTHARTHAHAHARTHTRAHTHTHTHTHKPRPAGSHQIRHGAMLARSMRTGCTKKLMGAGRGTGAPGCNSIIRCTGWHAAQRVAAHLHHWYLTGQRVWAAGRACAAAAPWALAQNWWIAASCCCSLGHRGTT